MIVRTFHALPAGPPRLRLGESARWNPVRQEATWVDIESGTLFAATGGDLGAQSVVAKVEGSLGCAIPTGDGYVLANENRVVWRDDAGSAVSPEFFPRDGVRRFNDGCLDSRGRLVVGTLSRGRDTAVEQLLRIDRENNLEVLREGVGLSNGVAFHPDGRLFHVDTQKRSISWADGQSDINGWRTAFTMEELPDGLHIGSDGTLWIAIWGKGQVRQYTDSGALLSRVIVDTPNVTSCAIVGASGDRLLITTAQNDIPQSLLPATQKAGMLFTADLTMPVL